MLKVVMAGLLTLAAVGAYASEPGPRPYQRGTPVVRNPLPWAMDVGVGVGPDVWAPEVGVSKGRLRVALSYIMLGDTTESVSHTVTSSKLVGLEDGKCYKHYCETKGKVVTSDETFTLETKGDDSYPMVSVGVVVWQSGK